MMSTVTSQAGPNKEQGNAPEQLRYVYQDNRLLGLI